MPVLLGNDIHQGALSLALRGAMKAGVDNLIEFKSGDAADFSHPALTAARDAFAAPTDLGELGRAWSTSPAASSDACSILASRLQ